MHSIYNWDKLPIVLDIPTVALIFGVSTSTVKRWIYNGTLKAVKIGKLWRFDREYIRMVVNCSEGV